MARLRGLLDNSDCFTIKKTEVQTALSHRGSVLVAGRDPVKVWFRMYSDEERAQVYFTLSYDNLKKNRITIKKLKKCPTNKALEHFEEIITMLDPFFITTIQKNQVSSLRMSVERFMEINQMTQ